MSQYSIHHSRPVTTSGAMMSSGLYHEWMTQQMFSSGYLPISMSSPPPQTSGSLLSPASMYNDMGFHMFKEVMFPEDSHYITIITIHQVVFSLSQLLNKDVTTNPVLHSTLEVVQVFN
eukprot:Em0006g1537a